MEFPIQPEEFRRPQAQHEDEEEENLEEEPAGSLNPLFVLVIWTLIVSFACTIARLVFLVTEKRYWHTGVPTLCYGAIAAIPYSTLDTQTAFTFEAISNAIAMQTYTEATTECFTKNYFISLSDGARHSIFAYLSAISALDLFGIFVIQSLCWHALYAKYCKPDVFRCLLAWNLIILSLDAVAIYEASRTKTATIFALSAVILACSLVILTLNNYILLCTINLKKKLEDVLELPKGIFVRGAVGDMPTPATGQARELTMLNPRNH